MTNEYYPYNLLAAIFEDKPEEMPTELTTDHRAGLDYALSTLEHREQEVLRLRFREKKGRPSIGKEFDIGQERVRQIENKAVKRMRYPQRLNFIKYGVAGYFQRVRTAEYKKGYELGYEKGYEDCAADQENGVTRNGYDIALMNLPLDSIGLDIRPYNCLLRSGCHTVGDCVRLNHEQISRMRNLGVKSADMIAKALHHLDIYNSAWDKFIIQPKETEG